MLAVLGRCDKCGVNANVKVALKNLTGDVTHLLFCAHHGNEYLIGGKLIPLEVTRNELVTSH